VPSAGSAERPRRLRTVVSQKLERLVDRVVSPRTERLEAQIDRLDESVAALRGIAAAVFDDIPALRRALLAARTGAEYQQAFDDPEPLVTVRIPTYERSTLLLERALPSVLSQSYQHLEVVVVGDGCTDETAAAIGSFGDRRVRFFNLPFRHPYPEDPELRWLVAGGPGANAAAELARGSWLALLGDDDEFEPHCLERLVQHARATNSEMVYGNVLVRRPPPSEEQILSCYPPRLGLYNCTTTLVMSALRCFEFAPRSWLLGEPADWNLCRRMIEAGVRIGHVDQVVTVLYPSHDWEPERFRG
jgi:hypothetical protein